MIPNTSVPMQDAYNCGGINVGSVRGHKVVPTTTIIKFKTVLRLPVYSRRSTFTNCYPSMVSKNCEKSIIKGGWSNYILTNMVTVISESDSIWHVDPLRWKSSQDYEKFRLLTGFAIDDTINSQTKYSEHADNVFDWMVAQSKPSIPFSVITHKVTHALLHSHQDDSSAYTLKKDVIS